MKAEINEVGTLIVSAENKIESYALDQWWDNNINGCTLQFKEAQPRCFGVDNRYPKITLFHRLKLRIQLFFYR
jgi:hypothetical protein